MNIIVRFTLSLSIICLFAQNALAGFAMDLDTIKITSGRFEQPGYELTGNVTVLTKEHIKATNAQTLPEVLQLSQGVNVYSFNTSKSSKVDIRGFGDAASQNVLVLVNGRRVNSISLSGADLIQIPVEAIERVEIIRGAGSVLYGDNAVGGVINVVTKKGEGELSGRIGAFGGSYDSHGQEAEISGEFKDLSYYAYSKYSDKRGYRNGSNELLKDYNTRLVYDIEDKFSIDFEIGRHEDSVELPGGLNDAELQTLGRRAASDDGDLIKTEDMYYKMSFDFTPWFEDNYWGSLVVEYSYRDRETFDSFAAFNFDTDRNFDQQGITAKYLFDHVLWDRDVHIVTGVDYYDAENDIIGSRSNSADATISKRELAGYGFLEFELFEDLFVNSGLRYQEADYEFDNRGTSSFEKDDISEVVYMSGLKYEYAKGSNIHFSAQQTFRFLTTDEFFSTFSGTLNTALEHQRGIQFETGIKHNFDNKIIASVTPYYILNTHEIFFDPTTFSNSNYPKTKRIGIEFDSRFDLLKFFDWNFFDKLEFFTNYTYQMPEFDEGLNDGKQIPMTAEHTANAGITTKIGDHYNLTLTNRYVGERFAINDVDNMGLKVKPYNIVDLKFTYEQDSFEFYVTVNNLFDRLYTPLVVESAFSSSIRDHYPAPERNFLAGINLKF